VLFSTYYQDKNLIPHLPGKGSTVTLSDPRYRFPLEVSKKTEDQHGSIFFCTVEGELQAERCEWWPDVGDIVSISAGHYCEWVAQQDGCSRFHALSELADCWLGQLTLLGIKEDKGQVSIINQPANQDVTTIWVPLTMLRVITQQGVRLRDIKKANLRASPEKAKPTAEQLQISDGTRQTILDKFGLKL
jgi:hypothetical protein